MEDRILRTRDVVAMTGRSRASIWRDEKAGRFPARVQIGVRAVGWRLSDVREWLDCLPRKGLQ